LLPGRAEERGPAKRDVDGKSGGERER
jgi:hypothetical protein